MTLIYSKMIFEMHLRSVSRAASQWLGIFKKSWRAFIIDYFLGDAFEVLSCPLFSTVLQCDARLPIHTLSYWGVFDCDIAHRRLLRCYVMYICCTRPGVTRCIPSLWCSTWAYDPERVTRRALGAHRCIFAHPRCRTSQYRRT